MDNEKKHCVTAAYHTFGFKISLHCGFIKYKIPSAAPGNVTARTSNIIMETYGKSARKYDALPVDLTPLIITIASITQVRARQPNSGRFGYPMPFSNVSASFKTSFL